LILQTTRMGVTPGSPRFGEIRLFPINQLAPYPKSDLALSFSFAPGATHSPRFLQIYTKIHNEPPTNQQVAIVIM
jgi:hypothetical protein